MSQCEAIWFSPYAYHGVILDLVQLNPKQCMYGYISYVHIYVQENIPTQMNFNATV